MSDCELYLNALLHYLTDGRLLPMTERKERQQGVRYIVMTLNGYTQQPYCDLPE